VLVRTNRAAELIRGALEDAGIPAVINGAGSVFATETAREWLRLLEALERPTSIVRAHSAALTPFLGWSPERIATADEAEWEDVHARLHDWARVLRMNDVASLVETIARVEDLPSRMLGRVDGERQLTDLRHIGQLLHAAQSAGQLGTTAMTGWLGRRIAEADQDTGDEERSRRLESDAEAVQVLTIHRSKGLEFAIVYLPFLWEPGYIPEGDPVSFHDPDADNARVLDVALEGTAFERHWKQYLIEQRGEDLRLAYVALTRARHQAIVWWAGSWDSRDSPLGRLLFARDPDGNVAPRGRFTPDDRVAIKKFEEIAARAPGSVSVERSSLALPTIWSSTLPRPTELAAATFTRGLDLRWRRTSYTDITAGAYDAAVASEPEEQSITDEPTTEAPVLSVPSAAVQSTRGIRCLLADMPVGLEIGTLVHRVFEATDFDTPDLDAELTQQVALASARRAVEIGEPANVVAGLRAVIETPLGPLVDNTRLRDIARADRLDELEFELPLAGGDAPRGWLTPALIAAILREHLPPTDALAGYADRLDDPTLRRTVHGYLTGFLDLVVRLNGAAVPRFAVLDYKTNWLAAADEQLTIQHYRPAAIITEMYRHHYALQALLYTVALHRYLRWRLPSYDPHRNLAGVLYLFVRGMIGADTPIVNGIPCGVFAWKPPANMVEALSSAIDRGAAV
jgi:exodeoxyribonuclease V beta subunit